MSRCYDLPSGPELDAGRQALADLRRAGAESGPLAEAIAALLPTCAGCACALDAEDGERYCRDCEHDGVQSDADTLRAFDGFHRAFAPGAVA